jgi:hypothetical protein
MEDFEAVRLVRILMAAVSPTREWWSESAALYAEELLPYRRDVGQSAVRRLYRSPRPPGAPAVPTIAELREELQEEERARLRASRPALEGDRRTAEELEADRLAGLRVLKAWREKRHPHAHPEIRRVEDLATRDFQDVRPSDEREAEAKRGAARQARWSEETKGRR